jgi:hypothetical protein
MRNGTERTVAAMAMRTILDPTNLLLFPVVPEKAIALGVRTAEMTMGAAKAAGIADPIAKSFGTIEHLLTNNQVTGPLIEKALTTVKGHWNGAMEMLDRTHGLPDEVKNVLRQHIGG